MHALLQTYSRRNHRRRWAHARGLERFTNIVTKTKSTAEMQKATRHKSEGGVARGSMCRPSATEGSGRRIFWSKPKRLRKMTAASAGEEIYHKPIMRADAAATQSRPARIRVAPRLHTFQPHRRSNTLSLLQNRKFSFWKVLN